MLIVCHERDKTTDRPRCGTARRSAMLRPLMDQLLAPACQIAGGMLEASAGLKELEHTNCS
jgi:hypothetical protein